MALLVAFAGLPGCGKTTVIELATKELRSDGFLVETTDIDSGEDSRELRAIARTYPLGHQISSMLLWVLRIQQHNLITALEDHVDIIFADRFWETADVLDGYGHRVPREVLEWVGRCIVRRPDITFLFEAPLEVVRTRKKSETIKDTVFAQRAAHGYRELADSLGWVRVDATRDPEEIKKDCLTKIKVMFRALGKTKCQSPER